MDVTKRPGKEMDVTKGPGNKNNNRSTRKI